MGLGRVETSQALVIYWTQLGFPGFDACLTALEDFRRWGLPQVRQIDGIVSEALFLV